MNLTFADVSTPLLNMIQQELPAEAMLNPQGAEVGKKMFADKLNKTLASVDQPGNETAVPDAMEKASDQVENTSGIISEKLDGKEGQHFVSALKTIFMMLSKGRLQDVSLDASGLETLEKMLLKAGFNQEDVTDLLNRLSEELEEGELSLDKVFEQLFDLPFEAKEMADPEIFLESSQAPFIESILVSLGIPAQTIGEILADADKGDQGVSLDVVIDKLQKIQKTDFYSGNSHTVSKSGSPIEQLSRSIGLKIDADHPNSFSLNDIVKALENLRQDKMQQSVKTQADSNVPVDEKPADLLNSLFKALKIEKDSPMAQMVAFDTDKIKDKFENPFLMTQDNASSKKGLFGFQAGESVKKTDLKGVFKEVVALLNSENGDSSRPKDPLTAAKDSVQKFVGTREKTVDQPQIQGVETKVSESEIKIELPKARPAAKPLPAYVTQQVGKSLVRAINQGENTLKIQLKPPELGRLMLTIDNTGNSMRVSIMTENYAAKEIITQNMTELRTVLSNSGVNLERFEVDMSSDFRQSMADARQQAGHSGKQGKNKGQEASGNGPSGGINETTGEMTGLNQDGSVHLVA